VRSYWDTPYLQGYHVIIVVLYGQSKLDVFV